MLDYERGLHAKVSAFFDAERLAFQLLDGAGCGQVDDDIGPALDFEPERFNDATALVRWVHGKTWRVGDAQRGFPAIQGFIVLIWSEVRRSSTIVAVYFPLKGPLEDWAKTDGKA